MGMPLPSPVSTQESIDFESRIGERIEL
jgi:hypothetical protein